MMKKLIAVISIAVLALSMAGCMRTNEETGAQEFDIFTTLIMVGMLVLLYFMMIRPQSKQRKKEEEMRASLEVGDGITTIGGIVGRVASIKDDTFVLETSSDRTKLRFRKDSIKEIEKLKVD